MSPSDKIVEAALSWVGTPYHHQARVKGVGVDCAQLVGAVAIEAGILSPHAILPNDYSPEWHLHNREELLVEYLERFGCKKTDAPRPGDILCFQYGRAIGHLGILVSDTQFVHARIDMGKVVLNTLSQDFIKRHKLTYTYPERHHDSLRIHNR